MHREVAAGVHSRSVRRPPLACVMLWPPHRVTTSVPLACKHFPLAHLIQHAGCSGPPCPTEERPPWPTWFSTPRAPSTMRLDACGDTRVEYATPRIRFTMPSSARLHSMDRAGADERAQQRQQVCLVSMGAAAEAPLHAHPTMPPAGVTNHSC